jgi:hypothetical protein
MKHRIWIKYAVFFLSAALIMGAPMAALCDDGRDMRLDTGGDKPIPDGPGVTRAISAQALPELNPGGEPPMVFAFSNRQPYTSGLAGYYDAYYLDSKKDFLNKLDASQPTDCADYKNTAISAALADLSEENRRALINVVGLCSRRPRGAQGSFSPDTQAVAWVPLDMQGSGEYQDLVTDARRVGDRIYQVVCGTNEFGVTCWEPGMMSTAPLPFQLYHLSGGAKFTDNLDVRYDYQGGLHMVGTDESGQLGYVAYPAGSNQPISESFKWLGEASLTQAWDWPQVGVAPDGTAYSAAFNSAEGYLYVFYKAADSPDHWFYRAMRSSSGPYGKYLSLAVDNKTGNAIISFRNGEGSLSIMILRPDGSSRTFAANSDNPYSTAAAAGNGFGVAFYPALGLEVISCRLGAKLEF